MKSPYTLTLVPGDNTGSCQNCIFSESDPNASYLKGNPPIIRCTIKGTLAYKGNLKSSDISYSDQCTNNVDTSFSIYGLKHKITGQVFLLSDIDVKTM